MLLGQIVIIWNRCLRHFKCGYYPNPAVEDSEANYGNKRGIAGDKDVA